MATTTAASTSVRPALRAGFEVHVVLRWGVYERTPRESRLRASRRGAEGRARSGALLRPWLPGGDGDTHQMSRISCRNSSTSSKER